MEGKLQAAFEAASKQVESLNSKNTATEGGETRYALNEKFSQQFDDWLEKRRTTRAREAFWLEQHLTR